jgi:hypothetical protein
MSAIAKEIANPELSKGSDGAQVKHVAIYIFSTGISALLGIWANGAIKAKAPVTVNPAIIDGIQIGAGIGIACIKNPIAQSIGVGQGIAGVVGLTQKGISYVKGKMIPATTQSNDGW